MNEPSFEWNVYKQNCPTRAVLERISHKWALLILGMLDGSPVRFNKLKREIEGISQKMLTQTLRSLERDGLVKRMVREGSPIAVEYEATSLGKSLAHAADPIRRWTEKHVAELLAARADYDAGIDDQS